MAAAVLGKSICPVCGAAARADNFGKDAWRTRAKPFPLFDDNPATAHRRARSQAFRRKNAGSK